MAKPTDQSKWSHMFTDDIKFIQKAVVFHPEKNTFITIRRSFSDRYRPGSWDLPGGNVLYGELYDVSLRREIKEETNLNVKTILPAQVKTVFDGKLYIIFIGFSGRSKNDEVKLSTEHTEYQWVTEKQFSDLFRDNDTGGTFIENTHFLCQLVNEVFSQKRQL